MQHLEREDFKGLLVVEEWFDIKFKDGSAILYQTDELYQDVTNNDVYEDGEMAEYFNDNFEANGSTLTELKDMTSN